MLLTISILFVIIVMWILSFHFWYKWLYEIIHELNTIHKGEEK